MKKSSCAFLSQRGAAIGCKRRCQNSQRSSLRSGEAELTVGFNGLQSRYRLRECMLLFSINKGGTAELVFSSLAFLMQGTFYFCLIILR